MCMSCDGGDFLSQFPQYAVDGGVDLTPAQKEYAANVAAGLCGKCGKPNDTPEFKNCSKCRERVRVQISKFIAEGRCKRCGKPNDTSTQTCSECRAKRSVETQTERALLKECVYAGYGRKCACCGEDEEIYLQIDHVNNDGHKHKGKALRGGISLYKKIIRESFPPEYQLLCANCNMAKAINGGVEYQPVREIVDISSDYHPVDISEWS